MQPSNRIPAAEAAAIRAKLSGKTSRPVAKKKPRSRPEERLIEPRYTSPETGIHILEVPCYLPTTNETYGHLRNGLAWLVDKHRIAARNNVLGCLARALPDWCVDIRAEGRAKALRDSVTFMVLSRIAPVACDDDNNVGALKGVRDTVCAWLVNGPVFDVDRIGDYDSIVYSPINASGRLQVVCDQDVRPERPYQPSRNGRPAQKRVAGRFGCKIELHSRHSQST